MQTPPTDQINLNTIIIVFLTAALGILTAIWLRSSGTKNKRIDDLEKDVAELKTNSAVTDVMVKPMWAKAQQQLSNELHHPHAENLEADGLIEKLENLEITPAETVRLKDLFVERSTDPDVTHRERKIAQIMPVIMDLVLEEAASDEPLQNVEPTGAIAPPKRSEEQS